MCLMTACKHFMVKMCVINKSLGSELYAVKATLLISARKVRGALLTCCAERQEKGIGVRSPVITDDSEEMGREREVNGKCDII